MKIVVFGTGIIYKRISEEINKTGNDIRFVDNNAGKCFVNGKRITAPDKIDYSSISVVVIASNKYAVEMRNQLLSLGITKRKIKHFDEFLKPYRKGKIAIEYKGANNNRHHLYGKVAIDELNRRAKIDNSILIISYHANYDGGSLASVHAVMALKSQGYFPILAVPSIDNNFLDEIVNKGICVAVCPNLINPSEEEMNWIGHWQRILVNTLQMSHATFAIGKRQKVIAWLHESPEVYEAYEYFHDDFQRAFDEKNVYVYAVSRVARDNFLKYYRCNPNSIGILPYGLPDSHIGINDKNSNKAMTFALIGSISKGKGVDIYLDAIENVNKILNECTDNAEFLLIGRDNDTSFSKEMIRRVSTIPNVRYVTQKNREDMKKIYTKKINVIVTPSRQDCLPTVVIEAMMYEHISIQSDVCGTTYYIKDGVNGFIFESENIDELTSKIIWCIKHPEKVHDMGLNARKIYENGFSLKTFASRLDKVIKEKLNS